MSSLKESCEFNCQELTRVTSELVDCKCELDYYKALNKELQRDVELKEKKIKRLESINNIRVKSLEMAIEIIRNGNY